jgi:flagellar hook-basal body complex protein FliE
MNNRIDSSTLLSQLRVMAKQAGLPAAETKPATITDAKPFTEVLQKSLEQVNERQQAAAKVAEAFELGDPNVDLSQVMIEMQKARISFETLSQVRNKVITAYQEIMNMPI